MPPAPRCAASWPSSSRLNRYGPRWETTITARRSSTQLGVEAQPVLELTGGKELLAHTLPPGGSHLGGALGCAQEIRGALGGGFDVVNEEAVDPVLDLQRDPAAAAADDGSPLPQPFADCQAETLPQRLL